MAKHRTHEVRLKERKSPLHCGTITKEQIMTADRAQRRADEIASGVFNGGVGTGVHGGGKRTRNRKERRESRQEIRNRDCS